MEEIDERIARLTDLARKVDPTAEVSLGEEHARVTYWFDDDHVATMVSIDAWPGAWEACEAALKVLVEKLRSLSEK